MVIQVDDNLDMVILNDDDDLLFDVTNLTSLGDDDEFPSAPAVEEILADDLVNMDDEELDKLLHEIIASNTDAEEVQDEKIDEAAPSEEEIPSLNSLDEERALFEMEKHLELEKIRLERQELENEKAKFERTKQEWESLRKLSEDSFQAEKEEYEKQKQLDREKMYLEAKELVNSCANVRDFIDNYRIHPDVSE